MVNSMKKMSSFLGTVQVDWIQFICVPSDNVGKYINILRESQIIQTVVIQ